MPRPGFPHDLNKDSVRSVRTLRDSSARGGGAFRSPWGHVAQAAAALAVGMGVGRFVYTPILPLMHAQAGLATGAHLQFPRSVALLTAGSSVGQILGPLVVTPRLHHGYHQALILAAVVVLAAAAMLRIGFPHHMVVVRHAAPLRHSEPAETTPDPGRRGA